ncbi:MAG TPA: pyruvate kinase [Candidatus Faeciplasma pullistercoris]|uniref:Pyruvate kinase n=1 Tax=Candidatus Faeciplasma pullistercoris TaxID=2840800 RepID=A0A9D1KLF6_9FIRM|nr:pyruvate kinase [Candidatus Faeciplasma pullistercoris]
MRKTKIICTIGPACQDEETMRQLMLAGMNVARLNFSHGTHEDHLQKINTIKKVRTELGLPVAIMLDTKGPEYRIRAFENGSVNLKPGDEFIFTTEDVTGNEKQVSVNYKELAHELEKGDIILLNNGLLSFEVTSVDGIRVYTTVKEGGELSNNKSMSFPTKLLKQKYLSEQDKSDLLFGIENDVDFVACSFVSCKQDVLDIKNFLRENGGSDIDIIAKIENQAGVDNIEDISEACEGIMIGRGDMGVEIPFEKLPAIQKTLITKCRLLGKRVITATEMLESMIHNPRPTRAETSDVANAVYDGTSAVMLSGETAAGKYPVLAVKTMAKICETTEQSIDYTKLFRTSEFQIKNTVDAISHATCGMAIDVNAKVIAVCSLSGMTARMVSRFRSPVDILGLTTDEKTCRKLSLSWGVSPYVCDTFDSTDVLFYTAKRMARDVFKLKSGDKMVVTGGITNGVSGNTNLIKVDTF